MYHAKVRTFIDLHYLDKKLFQDEEGNIKMKIKLQR